MFKDDSFVVGLILFFVAGFYSWPLLAASDLGLKGSELTGAIATLIAAYAGARFAFSFNAKTKKQEEESKLINNVHRFMTKLFLITNDLLAIEKYYILPARKFHPNERHVFLLSPVNLENNKYHINLDDVNFIMQPENFDLLSKTLITIEAYKTSIDAINQRTELMLEAQKIFDEKGVEQGQPCKAEYLISLIGPLLNERLKIHTNASIEFTEKTINDLFEIKDAFLEILGKIYPNEKFIDFKRPSY